MDEEREPGYRKKKEVRWTNIQGLFKQFILLSCESSYSPDLEALNSPDHQGVNEMKYRWQGL